MSLETPIATLAELRRPMVEKIWWGLLAVALLGTPLSLSRLATTGWIPAYTVHVTLTLAVLLVCWQLRRFSYNALVGMMVVFFWLVGVSGILSLGPLGAGIWWMSVSALLISALVSLRAGIISLVLVTAVILVAAYLFVSGKIELGFDANQYIRQLRSWAVLIVGATLLPLVVFFAFADYQNTLMQLLRRVQKQSRLIDEKNRELAQANDALTDFTSIVSHDLKEPIRGIGSFAALLRENPTDLSAEQSAQLLTQIHEKANHLTAMIDDLLHVSRVENGALQREPIDVPQLIEKLRVRLQGLLKERGAELVCADGMPLLIADRVRAGEVFYNLITNGLKYNASEHPRVSVGFEEHEGRLYYTVSDNGIGIPPNQQQRIFQMFRRAHQGDAYGGGTGVGLALVQKIIALHGGEILVHSAPGEGAKFLFHFGESTS